MAGPGAEGSAPRHERPMLASGGIYLRPAESEDIPRLVRWLNDAETSRYLAKRSPLSLAMEERWFERMLERHGSELWYFVVCRAADGRAIGMVALGDVDALNGAAEVGITLGEERGHGFGTDAMRAILDFGFGELRLERIWLDVVAENAPAIRSYEKTGFALEGTMRRALLIGGEFHDVLRMAILRSEWASGRSAG